MSIYQPVHRKIWNDAWFLDLKPAGKLLFFYLLTSPANTPSGIFECPLKKMAFETGLTVKQCELGLEMSAGHVEYDRERSLVWIVMGADYWPKNKNVQTAMRKEVEALNGHPFAERFGNRHPWVAQPLPNGSEKEGAS